MLGITTLAKLISQAPRKLAFQELFNPNKNVSVSKTSSPDLHARWHCHGGSRQREMFYPASFISTP
jgi:hypothetical protein